MKTLLIVLLTPLLALALWVRLAPMQPARWHVDPLDVTAPSRPNYDLRIGADAIIIQATMTRLELAWERVIAAEERMYLLAGAPEDELVTYVQRSAILRFPDAISIRFEAQGDMTRLHIFSRSRFGHSDLGVNRTRVNRLVTRLAAELNLPPLDLAP